MLHKANNAKCKVVKNVTEQATFYCLKPAEVSLVLHTPEPIALCLDCARELAKEIIDSTPGARADRSSR